MKGKSSVVFLRYWGSHFKSSRHAEVFASDFGPLVNKGWKCYLVLERKPDDPGWLERLKTAGVELIYLPRPRSSYDLVAIFRLYRLCRRLRPTIMHCDNIHAPALVAAALSRVPVRVWVKRSMSAHFEQCRAPTLKERIAITTRLSCYLATRVIAVSKAVKRELVDLGIRDEKVVVRENPRKLGPRPTTPESSALRKTLGLADERVVIATIGHAVPVKGWDLLLRAFVAVVTREPRAYLVLGGSYTAEHEKAFEEELREIITENGVDDSVCFLGYVSNVRWVLEGSDLFVLPSRSEGCANALIEALEAGLPCVATRVGNAEDIVNHGRNGYVIERCDVNGLSDAMLRLTRNSAERAALAARAKLPSSVRTLEEYAKQIAGDYWSWLPETRQLQDRDS